jgi:hypothetical protein
LLPPLDVPYGTENPAMIQLGSKVTVKGPLTVVQINGPRAMVEMVDSAGDYAMARLPVSWLEEHSFDERRGIRGVNPPHGKSGAELAPEERA